MLTKFLKGNSINMTINNYRRFHNATIYKDSNDIYRAKGKVQEANKTDYSYIDILNSFISLGKKLYKLNPGCVIKIGRTRNNDSAKSCVSNWAKDNLEVLRAECFITINQTSRFVYNGVYSEVWDDTIIDFINKDWVPYYYDSNVYDEFIDLNNLIDCALLSYLVTDCFKEKNYHDEKKLSQLFEHPYKESKDLINELLCMFRATRINFADIYREIEELVPIDKTIHYNLRDAVKLNNEKLDISYNIKHINDKYEYYTRYDSVFGLIIKLLQTYIYAYTSNVNYLKLCSCGQIITSKAQKCFDCYLLQDRERNRVTKKKK